jgi:WD40 repeat protein
MSLAIHPKGEYLVLGGQKRPNDGVPPMGVIQIWRWKTKKLVREWSPQNYPTVSVAFSRDGNLIASGSTDGTVKLREFAIKLREKR